MRIQIKNLQKIKRINLSDLKKKIKKILDYTGLSKKEISFVFCDNKLIKKINKDYLRKEYPTDVITFPLEDIYFKDSLGEIIISVEEAAKNAEIYKKDFGVELLLYVIHGILHLTGYNDTTKKEREKMREKEEGLLNRIIGRGRGRGTRDEGR